MRASMGCGSDPWGEIRVDLRRVSKANILADIQQLPFRDQVFDDVRCISVIEHVPGWYKALREILRISRKRLILEVPVNSDIRFTDIWRILFPTPRNLHLFRTIPQRARETLWQMDPKILFNVLLSAGFSVADPERIFQVYAGVPSRCWRITAWRFS